MKRRDFITLLGGAAAWPLAARAQQPSIPVVGFLHDGSFEPRVHLVAGFRQGLSEAGLIDDRNVVIEYRWAQDQFDRLPGMAADLVNRQVAVIATPGSTAAALAAKAATDTIPIVFSVGADPVKLGLVASLNRPGGNVTGMSNFANELWAKNVQLLKELVPAATVIGYLVNPASPNAASYLKGAAAAGSSVTGADIRVLKASTEPELDEAFASLAKLGAGGLVVPNEPFLDSHRATIVALAARYSIPTVYTIREYAFAGGLMSYGPSLADAYRKAAVYLGRILRGEKPSDLPVQQPTKFEMVINLKAAKALGLTVSPTLLLQADEVIE
jgi:putative ABC transport system substrate-binding protein